MENIEQKLNQIIRELAYIREQVELNRNDSQKFTINLDKEIKDSIRVAKNQILEELKKK